MGGGGVEVALTGVYTFFLFPHEGSAVPFLFLVPIVA